MWVVSVVLGWVSCCGLSVLFWGGLAVVFSVVVIVVILGEAREWVSKDCVGFFGGRGVCLYCSGGDYDYVVSLHCVSCFGLSVCLSFSSSSSSSSSSLSVEK